MSDSEDYIELEYEVEGKKMFTLISNDDVIWIDTIFLEHTVLLCAAYDGIAILHAMVGKDDGERRGFLPFDWLIKEFKEDKELAKALKEMKEKIEKSILELRKKYL